VGSMIGVISSLICYHIFWPSPFSAGSFKPDALGQPRYLYVSEGGDGGPFELARMDEDSIAYEA
jgi:diacylglycerol diphosphate phosphatase/phosphatidate phosphatase